MARRKVIWHIGPADPGTGFLSSALGAAAAELAERGIATPAGRWHEIEDQIWAHKGVSLLSTPGIARADQDKVSLRLNGLRDLEVHLVLLVRDLPTQVHASWQAGLQHGSTTTLPEYAARVLDPERSHWQAEEFWAGHDLGRILPLWTRAFHPERVHVVDAPADADGLWATLLSFADVLDVPRPQTLVPPALAGELDLDPDAQLAAVTGLLSATTAEVERLGAEVARLRAENDRLDRKRRKHKKKLAELTAV
ncbi:MAG: hypothetical protein J7518_11050 [Nocardioidaceae bacterium]|nr:hypothetical protein [Nocardioidaceae bacterium]